MRRSRGKLAAFITMALAVPVLVLAVWRPAMEAWYLHLLDSEDSATKELAAKRLGEIACYRAIPKLAESLLFPRIRDDGSQLKSALLEALHKLQNRAADPYAIALLRSEDERVRDWAMTFLARADDFGPRSFSALEEMLQAGDSNMRGRVLLVLPSFGSRAVPLLESALREGRSADSEWPRQTAASGLEELGPLAIQAAPVLIASLRDGDAGVRGQSLRALKRMDWDYSPALADLLRSADEELRRWAITALREEADLAPERVGTFVAAMKDTDFFVRDNAMAALQAMTPIPIEALEAFTRHLNIEDPNRYWSLRSSLASAGSRAVPALVGVLRAEDAHVRKAAAEVLGEIGALAKDAVPTLEACAKDPDDDVREAVLEALTEIRVDPKERAESFAKALEGKMDLTPGDAANQLGEMGPEAAATLPALRAGLKHTAADVRIQCAAAIARIDVDKDPDLSLLLGALGRGEELADEAANALGEIGPRARAAVPALLDAMQGKRFGSCRDALLKIGPTALLEVLGKPGSAQWENAIAVLQMIPASQLDARVLPILIECLDAQDADTVEWARRKMDALGSRAAAAIPALNRHNAVDALRDIGESAAPVVPALLAKLRNRPVSTQVVAARALGLIGPASVPGLTAALADPSEDIRCLAAFALGRIGPDALPALDLLRAMASDGDATVRLTAKRAIERIAANER